jgi:hypothetical protein
MSPLPASLDHRALTEPDAADQRASDSMGRPAQESVVSGTILTVHVLEPSAAENSPGVAAGS